MRRETGSDAGGVRPTPGLENYSRSHIYAEFWRVTAYSICSEKTYRRRSAILDRASAGRATLVKGVRP
jgi:hypothetical protein